MSSSRFQPNSLLADFEARLHARVTTEAEAILAGRCKDHTEYKVRVERRLTLLIALEDLDASLRAINEDDDE